VGARLDIITLGGLSIQQDGKPVTGFVSRKVEALLVYLAANPREHPREVLGQLLWDDLPQDRTLANLRMALSSLQQQVESHLVVTRYSLAIDPDSGYGMDTFELDNAINEANQHWKESGRFPPPVAKRLETALNRYQGGFLEGFYVRNARGFEGWKSLEQERIRYRVLEALYRLGSNALQNGQYAEGITYITRLLQYDPLWEEAHRLMMLLLAYSGNRSAALAQYETCQRVLKENLDVDPADETFDLYCQIDDGEIKTVVQERIPHNLPVPTTPFIGRSTELSEIGAQLSNPDCRLLTLTGSGGIGKTRLALEVAQHNLASFPQGIYLIPLNGVTHREHIIQTIADTLQVNFSSTSDPLPELTNALHDKHMLLILDNFEHILEEADLLSHLLSRTEGVKLLVTTTERLNLQEEWLYPVEGLSSDSQDSAVQLFVQTAQRIKRDFTLNNQHEIIAHICDLVGGLPLGIELAASWVHILSCQQIAEQIQEDPTFLATSLRNLPERHRSLRILFEQALNRLDEASRAAFLKLSVFQGDFTRQAAAQVAGASLPVLASLVEKSLLSVPDAGHYEMHMLLNRFAYSLLEQSGELTPTENAHIRYYTELAEKLAKQDDDTGITAVSGNLFRALNRAAASQQGDYLMRLANALTFYWRRRGYVAEGRKWLQQALTTVITDSDLRARTLANGGILAWNQSDFAAARDLLTQSLNSYRDRQDTDGIYYVLRYLGHVALNQGEFEIARAHYAEILAIAQELSRPDMMVVALGNLGQVAMDQNDLGQAQKHLEESLIIARQHSKPENVAVLLNNLGNIHIARGDYTRAGAHYEESLVIARQLGHQPNIAFALVNLGEVAHNLGNYEGALSQYREGILLLKDMGDRLSMTAVLESYAFVLVDRGEIEQGVQLLASAAAAREQLNSPLPPREQPRYDRYWNAAKAQLDDDRYAVLWRAGQLLSLEQALADLTSP
jgi:predicted ATPase/DNA-binding SARP family transcriptional activator